jgi:hypothetical protein
MRLCREGEGTVDFLKKHLLKGLFSEWQPDLFIE